MAKKTRKTKARKTKKRITRKKRAVKKHTAPARKKSVVKRKGKTRSKAPKLPEEAVGRVTHYFPKARATAVMIERDGIRVGDVLYYKGHTTRFKQKVESLQIDRQAVSEASTGQEVGIRVKSRTREHDLVFKL